MRRRRASRSTGASPWSPAPPACSGASTAARWPRRGATVVATDVDAGRLRRDRARAQAKPASRRCIRIAADITDADGARARCATRRRSRGDRLDVLVNNAAIDDKFDRRRGGEPPPRFENYPLEAFRRVARRQRHRHVPGCQVLGARDGAARAAAASSTSRRPTASSRPTSASTAGPTASRRFWKSAVYPASKGAVLAFTRFLATYWGERGVRVNSAVARRRRAGGAGRVLRRELPPPDAARPHGAAERATRARVVFLASDASQLHDRRQPGRRRRVDRMVMNDGLPVTAPLLERELRDARRAGQARGSPTSTACSPTAASTTPRTGEALKRFSVRDGMGVERLRAARRRDRVRHPRDRRGCVERRAEKLSVRYCYLGVGDKRQALAALARGGRHRASASSRTSATTSTTPRS